MAVKGILGKKLSMTQIWNEAGEVVPVTVILAGPCTVLQVKTKDNDGYRALQLGFGDKRKATKPLLGHFKKSNAKPKAFVREVPIDESDAFEAGQTVTVEVLAAVKKVDVIGTSKGRGFQGCVKRHNFNRGPVTHGTKNTREPGSSGQNTSPGHVWKGKRMSGHMGAERKTVRNLDVVKVEKEQNLLYLRGGVPGPNGGFVYIRPAVAWKGNAKKA